MGHLTDAPVIAAIVKDAFV